MTKPKFQKRYVLGEGWPLPYYQQGNRTYAVLMQSKVGTVIGLVDFPIESADEDCPKYRLVLERVEVKK